MNINKKSIIELITEDNLEKALEHLITLAKKYDQDLLSTAIHQSGRIRSLQKQEENGTITPGQATRTRNQIRAAVTSIVRREVGHDWDSPEDGPEQKKRVVLFLAANPRELDPLRLGEEIRKVEDGFRIATLRDTFRFKAETAVRVRTITLAMQTMEPEIVHFSGHGSGEEGISVENDEGEEIVIPTEGLSRLFRLFKPHVKCVVLNACYSQEQAEAISEHGIYVIGMNEAIDDDASIKFSVGFYQSIGEGKNYKYAFEMGMFHISSSLEEATKPELWKDGQKIA
ncbi:MAG: CHAT domain-containing protein [Saprospiraceae bacterium]|nr:CHAT domain-containing protein [Saprospiraceae bacterium]